MNADEIIVELLIIKANYPSLTNDEVLKILEIQIMSRSRNGM